MHLPFITTTNHPGKKLRFLVTVMLFTLVLTACQGIVLPSAGSDQQAGSGEVYFKDDFSDPSSGWDRLSGDGGTTDYFEGTYRILVTQPKRTLWANPKLFFNDLRIEADVTKAEGGDNNVIGLICRYQDQANFYAFFISSDGYYGITKVIEGVGPKLLGTDKMSASEVINKGNDANHLRADCVANKLTLYVNGQMLTSAEDADLDSGDIGLLAGNFGDASLDVRFDNLVVSNP
jgi:hypothetical protein